MKRIIVCLNCGTEFTIRKKERVGTAKFCSRQCKHDFHRTELECANCGKIFRRPKGIIRSKKALNVFCSNQCRYEHQSRSGPWNKGINLLEVTCDWCGQKIVKPQSILKQYINHFCCKECYNRWMSKNKTGSSNNSWKSKEVICDQCKKTFLLPPSKIYRYPHLFCSNGCKYQWMSENLSRENNHNWVGGHIDSRGSNWKEQRLKALERDDYTCQKCDSRTMLDVHHKIPFRIFGLERYIEANNLDNLITVCKKCHARLEMEYNREQKKIECMVKT